MDLKPVKSTNVLAVGYDPVTKTLGVQYQGGGIYHYHDVPPRIYEGMAKSKSIGTFLHRQVKGAYPFSKQPENKDEQQGKAAHAQPKQTPAAAARAANTKRRAR